MIRCLPTYLESPLKDGAVVRSSIERPLSIFSIHIKNIDNVEA
jgi:hypothetical protein